MQFTAQDDVTSVVEAMESSITSSFEAITSAMDELDIGLLNLSTSAENMAAAFEEITTAFSSAEDGATSFQSALDDINGDNIDDVSASVNELSDVIVDAEGEVENLSEGLSSLDGTSIDINIEASGLASGSDWDADAELGGELTDQDTSALRTSMYDDIVGFSDSIRGLGSDAVESASAAEQGWLRFGNAVNTLGGNWEAQESQLKSWVKTFSNNMGRGVADTRTAMTTFMNMGMSVEETQKTMEATSNYAAQFGISQAEAAKMIQMSFMGAGRSVKKLGLDIKDFKDESGKVDREKLLAAIMEKTSGAAGKYADSYEARVQRMNNAINSLRTDFGREIINTIEPLIPIVQQAFAAFSSLPQPVKSSIIAFAGLAGGAAIVAGPLIKMRAYLRMSGTDLKSLVGSVQNVNKAYNVWKNDGLQGVIGKLKEHLGLTKAAKAGEGLGGMTGAGKGMATVEKEAGQVVKSGSGVAGMAGEASSAGAGMQATSVSLKGIGQGAMSMLAPLLEIALVVAVLIPVIAALAAEALIFLKGIQLLLDALNFDSIDLKPTVEAIKQIGQALLEMGIAMAEMTFASLMTASTAMVNGILGLMNPVKTAGDMLKQAAAELAKFKDVNLDKSVPDKLKNISAALKEVSLAMLSLNSVVVSMAVGNLMTLGGRLGTIKQAMAKAREEIINASQEIAKIKDLPDIEEGAVEKLKKISESLESVSKAMDALRSIRDDYNWDNFIQGIFGGVDIQTALANVKQDIIKAANALQGYTGLPEIPEEVGTRMKKIADTLKSTSEALTSLRSIRDNYNWDSFMQGLFGGLDIPGAINAAKGDLISVGNTLASLTALPEIPDGIYTKVQRIGSSAKNVGSTLQGMQNMPFPDVINLVLLPAKIASARGVLMSTSQQLASLNAIQAIPDGLYTKVQRVGTSARNVGVAVQGINTIPLVGPDVGLRIKMAVGAVRSAANELSGLQGVSVAGDMNQALASVRNAIIQLRATLNSMRGGFRSAGVGIGASLKGGIRAGVAGLPGVVSSTVASGMSAGVGPAHSGGTRIGNAGKTSFQNSFKISQVASNEVSYATQAIQNGTAAFVQAVGAMAEQAVQEAKNKLDQQSPGRIARMFGAEMDFSRDLVLDRGQGIVRAARTMSDNVVNAWNMGGSQVAFTTPGLDAARLDSLRRMNQSSSMGQTQRPVAIHIGEGAIQLDARNLTTKESRQIMINAIEGLDMVSGIDLKGV